MKIYKSLIVGSLLVAFIISVPTASFAESEKGNNSQNNNTSQVVQNQNRGRFGFFNSFWNKFKNEFKGKTKNSVASTTNSLAPSISGITAPTVLKAGDTGTWTVKASDPQNSSLQYSVDWGDTAVQPLSMLSQPSFVQNTTFTHAYSSTGKYTITFTVTNSSGLKTSSTVTVHIVGQQVTTTIPVINNLSAVSNRPQGATINFTTDVKGNSLVWYSKTSPVDTSVNPNVTYQGKTLNHRVELYKLDPSTTYYVIVGSSDNAGRSLSTQISFTTPATNTIVPVITSLTGPSTIVVNQTETVVVNAYDPQNGTLSYTANWGDGTLGAQALLQPIFVQSSSFSHVYTAPGTYTAIFTAENSSGQKATSSMNITVTALSGDVTGPVMSNIMTSSSNSTSTITWTTNEASTSQVYYSTGTPVDVNSSGTSNISNASLVTSHSLNITNLTANTLYHFVIKSVDSSNNPTVSSELTFATTN